MKEHQVEFLTLFGDRAHYEEVKAKPMGHVFSALFVNNPISTEADREGFLKSEDYLDRSEVASSNLTSDEHLKQLLRDPHPTVRATAAVKLKTRLQNRRNAEIDKEYGRA